jgi:hypothetical protein
MPEEQKAQEPIAQEQAGTTPKHPDLDEKVLLNWTAPARPFKRGSREFYVKAASIGVLLSIILFLIEGPLPVLLVISIGFLVYVYMNVEPGNINYAITNKGVKIHNKVTPWEQMGYFWFSHRLGSELLVIEANVFGGRLEMVIPDEQEIKIKETLAEYITYHQMPPTNTDKIINWFSTKVMS